MPEFSYTDLLPVGPDSTEYRLVSADGISTRQSLGRDFVEVEPGVLTQLTAAAMRDIAHLLRPGHLSQLRSILDDPEASGNDRFVARDLLKNACIAAGGVLPMCPLIVGTALVAHISPSAKRDDLHRDGRYAMHSFPCDDNEDAFYITGRAALVGDASLARAAAAQFLAERDMPAEPPGFGDGEFFEFRLSRCLLTRTDGHGDWNPRHATWSADAGPGNGDGHPG